MLDTGRVPVWLHTRTRPHKASTTGAWVLDETQPYFIDISLVAGLASFFRSRDVSNVIEFGAGKGYYADALNARGVHVRAFDGAGHVKALTRGLVHHADLTTRLNLGAPTKWVYCLEVAEHVPRQHMNTLLDNLHRHNTKGIVLSWSRAKAGVGHVNPLTKVQVTTLMKKWNYTEDEESTQTLQAAATFQWFKESRIKGIRGGGVRVWQRQQQQ